MVNTDVIIFPNTFYLQLMVSINLEPKNSQCTDYKWMDGWMDGKMDGWMDR